MQMEFARERESKVEEEVPHCANYVSLLLLLLLLLLHLLFLLPLLRLHHLFISFPFIFLTPLFVHVH